MAKEKLLELAQNKGLFHNEVKLAHHNLASLLFAISNGQTWEHIPLSIIIQNLPKLQPRFYSISSSSLSQPQKPSITVAVESKRLGAQNDATFKGLASNYLLALKAAQHLETSPRRLAYDLQSSWQDCRNVRVFIHLRQSSFRLPTDKSVPIIMIGPGTGVAPFRGFVQERAKQADQGKRIGQTMLFFGCRRSTEDFIYKAEWEVSNQHQELTVEFVIQKEMANRSQSYRQSLGTTFQLITAFSREGPNKVYVQDRLREHGHDVSRLLNYGAHVYVCGEAANMARQVQATLIEILVDQRNMVAAEAEKILKTMKNQKQYQVSNYPRCRKQHEVLSIRGQLLNIHKLKHFV